MKKIILLLIAAMPLFAPRAAEYNAVLVADMDSGRILYDEHGGDLNYPASLTKLMTLYITFDALEHGRLRLDQNLIVSKTAAAASPVKIGLPAGSKITVENAIKAVVVYSANDMAVVLSENLKGDEGDFASIMTKRARDIGLKDTNFSNASGLSEDDHISTAKDMTMLAIALKKHYPEHWHYFSLPYFTYGGKSYRNGNALLGAYPGCDGMKTGFTNKSGYSVIATAEHGGRHLVATVLGANGKSDRSAIARALLDYGFGKTDRPEIGGGGEKYAYQAPAPVQQPARSATGTFDAPVQSGGNGGAGVQFGAFGSADGAKRQQEKVRSLFGVSTYLEKHGSMTRVRANMNVAEAEKIKNQCRSKGLDCFIFR